MSKKTKRYETIHSPAPNHSHSRLRQFLSDNNNNDFTQRTVISFLPVNPQRTKNFIKPATRHALPRDLINHLLADELLFKIFTFLDTSAVSRATLVNKRWNAILRDNVLWLRLCQSRDYRHFVHRFGSIASSSNSLRDPRKSRSWRRSVIYVHGIPRPISFPPWYQVYKENYLTEQNWKRGRYQVSVVNNEVNNGNLNYHFDDSIVVSTEAVGQIGDVWELNTGKLLVQLVGHSGTISTVKLDKTHIVSGSTDRSLKVWDRKTGVCILTLLGHEGEISASMHDAKYVVSGSEDHTVKVWDIQTGELVQTFEGHDGAVTCVYFEGDSILSGSTDMTIKMWSIRDNRCKRTLRGHLGEVYCVAYRPSQGLVVSGGEDNDIRLWNVDGSADDCRTVLQGHESAVVCLQVDDGKIVSGSADKSIKVWDWRRGLCLYTLKQHTGAVRLTKFFFFFLNSRYYIKAKLTYNLSEIPQFRYGVFDLILPRLFLHRLTNRYEFGILHSLPMKEIAMRWTSSKLDLI